MNAYCVSNTMNYFNIFGLPIKYKIDSKILKQRFQILQSKFHPDVFISSSKAEQKSALKYSSLINQAWLTLSNDISRAEYIISLKNVEKKEIIEDKHFLEKQFIFQERLQKIEILKDKKAILALIKNLENEIQEYLVRMAYQVNKEEWEEAASIIYKLHFLKKLEKRAEIFREKLFPFELQK